MAEEGDNAGSQRQEAVANEGSSIQRDTEITLAESPSLRVAKSLSILEMQELNDMAASSKIVPPQGYPWSSYGWTETEISSDSTHNLHQRKSSRRLNDFINQDANPEKQQEQESSPFLNRMQTVFGPGKSNLDEEPKKEVCSSSRLLALKNFVLFHLPAIAVTLVLLSLYIRQLEWAPNHPTTQELNALQFAAKVHESLILVSITDILLHRIHYGLLRSNDGVALGLLSSPFRLATPIGYLFSGELWSSVFKPVANQWFHNGTSGVILLLILVSIGASPFSAILMIPRLAWWEDNVSSIVSDEISIVYTSQNIYPAEFTSARSYFSFDNLCETIDSDIEAVWECGVPNIEPLLTEYLLRLNPIPESPMLYNISLSDFATLNQARPVSFSVFEEKDSPTGIATAPMAFAAWYATTIVNDIKSYPKADFLVRIKTNDTSKPDIHKQPLVAVSCEIADGDYPLTKDILTFDFFNSFHGNFSAKLNMTNNSVFNKSMLSDGKNNNETYPVFLDIQDQVPVPISAGILLLKNNTQYDWARHGNVSSYAQLCLIQARWRDADMWASPDAAFALTNMDVSTPHAMASLRNNFQNTTKDTIINIEPKWLSTLKYPNESSLVPDYRQAVDGCLDSNARQGTRNDNIWNRCIPSFLSIYLADALSSSVDGNLYYHSDDPDESEFMTPPSSDDTIFNIRFFQHLSAYRFENSKTIPIALGFLLFHALLAIIHTLIIILSPKPWHSSGWGSIGELIALALQSKSPETLNNIGGGVSHRQTWQLGVSVREVAERNQLEMIVDTARKGPAIRPEEGDERNDANILTNRVRTGVKYG